MKAYALLDHYPAHTREFPEWDRNEGRDVVLWEGHSRRCLKSQSIRIF